MTRIDVRQGGSAVAPSTPGLLGQAAHYIGTWDVGATYAAGECVRSWDATNGGWALFQAKTATTGDTPDITQSTDAWALLPQDGEPIIMWGTQDPNTTSSSDPHGQGISAPPGSLYLWQSGETSSPSTIVLSFQPSEFGGTADFPGFISGPIWNGSWSAARLFISDNDPLMTADARVYAHTRFGSGDADTRAISEVDNALAGSAFAGATALHVPRKPMLFRRPMARRRSTTCSLLWR